MPLSSSNYYQPLYPPFQSVYVPEAPPSESVPMDNENDGKYLYIIR